MEEPKVLSEARSAVAPRWMGPGEGRRSLSQVEKSTLKLHIFLWFNSYTILLAMSDV